jgi:hypothetical protein
VDILVVLETPQQLIHHKVMLAVLDHILFLVMVAVVEVEELVLGDLPVLAHSLHQMDIFLEVVLGVRDLLGQTK